MDQIPEMYRRRREERRRERRQQITGVQVVFVSILAIGLLLTINFSARIRRGQVYTDLRNEVQGTLDALQQQNTDLRKELDFSKSDAAVAQWAHEDGKMVRPGEVLIIPVPGYNVIPTPTPTRSPVIDEGREPEVPVWQLWWSLFFDGDPP
ncbi:MAG: septum formation initiator family protein [Anaerolineales bacterium]|nr:septum formation initiator family protein [Anaerolineales bacterium]